MVEFSKRLRQVRMESGKKQREAAEHIGLKIRSYQFYEQGTSEPNIQKLIALADFFDVSLDYLMGRIDAPR